MEDPNLLTLIASRASNDVLELLSRTPSLWNAIEPQLHNQHFWYLRTEATFNLPPELEDWESNRKENWQQIYNIMLSTKTDENPFLSARSVLWNNSYNTAAVKWLLKLYDPSVDHGQVLAEAAGSGNVETTKLLLADPRIDPLASDQQTGAVWALYAAAQYGMIDVLRTLLADPRLSDPTARHRHLSVIELGLLGAAAGDQVGAAKYLLSYRDYGLVELEHMKAYAISNDSSNILRLVLDDPKFIMVDVNAPIVEAIKHNSVRILSLLIDRGYIPRPRVWIIAVIKQDNIEMLRILMGEDWMLLRGETILGHAANEGALKILDLTLEDETIDKSVIVLSIQLAVKNNQDRALSRLLRDPRSRYSGSLLASLLRPEVNASVIEVILRDRRVDLSEIIPSYLDAALQKIRANIDDRLEGALMLSKTNKKEILSYVQTEYNANHFQLLLRELAVKRLDSGYYLDWIIDRVRRPSTSLQVRKLVSSAAASVLSEEVVHTSPDFTAYSGFFLLISSKFRDGQELSVRTRAVMNTLEMEGASQEGLKKAGMLIEAFLGKEKLNESN